MVVVLDGDDMLIFATAAGATRHPDWYFNLKANPQITVEYGTESFKADVVEVSGAEAEARVTKQAASTPQFAKYVESAAPRTIPVFSISRV